MAVTPTLTLGICVCVCLYVCYVPDERARRLDSDIPSDLDSVAAQQIDIKFKEIMRKKKGKLSLTIHLDRIVVTDQYVSRLLVSSNMW